ncbi:hypothetical protein DSM21852_27280 [Methylocystis bryophila]|nr:hypothetical protein DSM21852_27280 [Methylocystis bryophila]
MATPITTITTIIITTTTIIIGVPIETLGRERSRLSCPRLRRSLKGRSALSNTTFIDKSLASQRGIYRASLEYIG